MFWFSTMTNNPIFFQQHQLKHYVQLSNFFFLPCFFAFFPCLRVVFILISVCQSSFSLDFLTFFLPCFLTLGFLTTIIGLPIICLTTSGLPTLVCLTTSGFLISGVLITTTSGFLISGVLTGFPIFLTVAPICPKPSVRFCSCFGVGGGFFFTIFL